MRDLQVDNQNSIYKAINLLYRLYKRLVVFFQAKYNGIHFFPPNYVYRGGLNSHSILIDVGCGSQAELSRFFIERFQARVHCIDPTRKHASALKKLEAEYGGLLKHHAWAVTAGGGEVQFNESCENESGSIFSDHANIKRDVIQSYTVAGLTLSGLLEKLGINSADFLKLDLEGAEYELIPSISCEVWRCFGQIYIEFHHHCIGRFHEDDTRAAVHYLKQCGYRVFTANQHDYLFFR